MNDNDKKLREILEKEEVPKELEPENVKTMLDEKSAVNKRKKISSAGRVAAMIAACAVICGGGIFAVNQKNMFDNNNSEKSVITTEKQSDNEKSGGEVSTGSVQEKTEKNSETSETSETSENPEVTEETDDKNSDSGNSDEEKTIVVEKPYMNGAESYNQIYTMLKTSYDDYKASQKNIMDAKVQYSPRTGGGDEEMIYGESAEVNSEDFYDEAEDYDFSSSDSPVATEKSAETEFSETYNQEENVLEADIVKTDGKYIYYLNNSYDYDNFSNVILLNIAGVDNGTFTSSSTIEINPQLQDYDEENYSRYINVSDMYLYNDMIIVIGSANTYYDARYYYVDGTGESLNDMWYDNSNETFVSFYTTGENPELIGTYHQDGYYSNVRISPEGYMYLVSSYSTISFDHILDENNIERYIPSCGVDEDLQCLPPEDILMPEDYQPYTYLDYTVIGSIDLNNSGEFTPVDQKALAGYTGDIYTSAENMYITVGWQDTDITRISVKDGNIVPVASGTVKGWVKDQFSMSEYNGYFRIATTFYDENENQDEDVLWWSGNENNAVYILDMDLNEVGKISDFGIDETIKSVNFSGDTAYVVTYEQTDPLFAIDLSNPAEPVIMDELKILGYSTYMQKWGENLLLGFGADADENGRENGYKLVMFDNSDPYNLKEFGRYSVNYDRESGEWFSSDAMWERKALLIAPEKNLIGIPIYIYSYNYSSSPDIYKYMFFSYDNGEFTFKGEISSETESYESHFDRAVYIGDYVYVVSGHEFVSADIDTITQKDRVEF